MNSNRGESRFRIPYALKLIGAFSALVVPIIWIAVGYFTRLSDREYEEAKVASSLNVAFYLLNSGNVVAGEPMVRLIEEVEACVRDKEQASVVNFSESYNQISAIPPDRVPLLFSENYRAVSGALTEMRARGVDHFVGGVSEGGDYLVTDIPLIYLAMFDTNAVGNNRLRVVADSASAETVDAHDQNIEHLEKRFYSSQYFIVDERFPLQRLWQDDIVAFSVYDDRAVMTTASLLSLNSGLAAILMGDIDFSEADRLHSAEMRYLRFGGIALTVVIVAIIIALGVLFGKPIRRLKREAVAVASPDLSVRFYTRGHDEFGVVADNINAFLEHTVVERERSARTIRWYKRVFPPVNLDLLGKESVENVTVGEYVERNTTVLQIHYVSDNLDATASARDTIEVINTRVALIEEIVQRNRGVIESINEQCITVLFPMWVPGAIDAAVEIAHTPDTRGATTTSASSAVMAIHHGAVALGVIGGHSVMKVMAVAKTIHAVASVIDIAKRVGAPMIITQSYMDIVSHFFKYQTRYLGRASIGNSGNSMLYEIIDAYSEEEQKSIKATRLDFEDGVRMYEKKEVAHASDLMKRVHESDASDRVAAYFARKLSLENES